MKLSQRILFNRNLFSLHSFSLFSCWHIVTPFTLYAVLVYFQMNYGLLLYLKLARVDVGSVSKKGENMEGIIYLKYFYWLVFNRTLSIYCQTCCLTTKQLAKLSCE